MATAPTSAPQTSGALASVTGALRDLVNQATPVVSSYFDYRAARETSRANVSPGIAANPMAADPVPSSPSSAMAAAKWLPWAIIGAVVAVGGFMVLAMRRR
jgi:hypothetical protein